MYKTSNAFSAFCTPPQTKARDARIARQSEPWVLHFEGITLHGWRAGPAAGKTALVVHGWGSQSDAMSLIASTLVSDGFSTFAVDMPAHGRTRSANPERPTTNLKEWVGALREVVTQLLPDGADVCVGHSFGGLAAAFSVVDIAWCRLPTARIRRLALLGSPAGMDDVISSDARASLQTAQNVKEIVAGVEAVLGGPVQLASLSTIASALPPVLALHDPLDAIASFDVLTGALAGSRRTTIHALSSATHDGIVASRTAVNLVRRFAADQHAGGDAPL